MSFAAAPGVAAGPSVVTREVRTGSVQVQLSYPSPPTKQRLSGTQEAEAQRRQTEERKERERAKLAAFQRTTLQRATLKVTPAVPAPVVAPPTEFEIALREAVANNERFIALMSAAGET